MYCRYRDRGSALRSVAVPPGVRLLALTVGACLAIAASTLLLYAVLTLLEPLSQSTRAPSLVALVAFAASIAAVSHLLVVYGREDDADEETEEMEETA